MTDLGTPTQLDNVIWHALTGPHRSLAHKGIDTAAARYDAEISPFGAVAAFDPESWHQLARQCDPDEVVVIFRDSIGDQTPGFDRLGGQRVHQMVAPAAVQPNLERAGVNTTDIAELGASDTEAMMRLTQLTKPGPFLPGTVAMGRFFGIRHGDDLVAMAGTRFATDSWCEISAVCTHPNAVGRGYGSLLTEWVAAHIQTTNRAAFLHVTETNIGAKRVYDQLGFQERRMVDVAGFSRSR